MNMDLGLTSAALPWNLAVSVSSIHQNVLRVHHSMQRFAWVVQRITGGVQMEIDVVEVSRHSDRKQCLAYLYYS